MSNVICVAMFLIRFAMFYFVFETFSCLDLDFSFRAFQPVLGRIFHVESEFEVKNKEIWRPGGKIEEKRIKL